MSSLSLQETLCYCGFCVCLLGSRLHSQTLRNVAVFACAAAIVFWIRSRATKETKTFLLFLSYTQTGEDFRERWCQGKSAKKVCSLTRLSSRVETITAEILSVQKSAWGYPQHCRIFFLKNVWHLHYFTGAWLLLTFLNLLLSWINLVDSCFISSENCDHSSSSWKKFIVYKNLLVAGRISIWNNALFPAVLE